ncbi:MAG TPA: sigma-70 family RNA polymerase sigma factor [Opitutaceae bacterium]|nr:sigma-70 family RNA polymerase sigma factor [Opitutaceae bacterium]
MNVDEEWGISGERATRTGSFPETQWSIVLRSDASGDTRAHAALESLCLKYWYPLYTFVRRQGRDHHEAEDCTQEFFARLLSAEGLKRARPERGRFRSFLLSGMRNFLTSEWRRASAAKRGGGLATVPIGTVDFDERFCHEPRDTALTPEQAFDRSWALGMIDRAVGELRAEYVRSGRGELFDSLAPQIWGGGSGGTVPVDVLAARLEMTAQAYAVALHRARRRLGDRLRARVAETVADSKEIDAELRHLVAAINEATGPA